MMEPKIVPHAKKIQAIRMSNNDENTPHIKQVRNEVARFHSKFFAAAPRARWSTSGKSEVDDRISDFECDKK